MLKIWRCWPKYLRFLIALTRTNLFIHCGKNLGLMVYWFLIFYWKKTSAREYECSVVKVSHSSLNRELKNTSPTARGMKVCRRVLKHSFSRLQPSLHPILNKYCQYIVIPWMWVWGTWSTPVYEYRQPDTLPIILKGFNFTDKFPD